jgi:hypothetical protein
MEPLPEAFEDGKRPFKVVATILETLNVESHGNAFIIKTLLPFRDIWCRLGFQIG